MNSIMNLVFKRKQAATSLIPAAEKAPPYVLGLYDKDKKVVGAVQTLMGSTGNSWGLGTIPNNTEVTLKTFDTEEDAKDFADSKKQFCVSVVAKYSPVISPLLDAQHYIPSDKLIIISKAEIPALV